MTRASAVPAIEHHSPTSAPLDFDPENFCRSFFGVARTVLFFPRSFFARVNYGGGLKSPFIFLICCALVHTLFVGLSFRSWAIIALSLANGIALPFVTAGLLFLIATRVFKGQGTYGAAFRINAYSAATALCSWIPLGGFLLEFYRLYLIGLGLGRAFSLRPLQVGLTITLTIIIYVLAFSALNHVVGPLSSSGMGNSAM
jgi:hypothetical protein